MRQPYGQNFLVDNNIANKIIQAANIQRNDTVIEVGPGKGALTNILKNLTDNLIAVDIDRGLAKILQENYKDANNITVINKDFLKFDLPTKPFKIVANLPYNVGTAIVQKFLPCKNFVSAVIMLQKDVIIRLASSSGTKDYGYISLFRQYYADAKMLFDVPPGCFNPKPQVMSAVIQFINKNPQEPTAILFPLIKHCFSMRRKTILNGLSTFVKEEKSEVIKILNNLKIDTMARPDKLNLDDYLKICQIITI
ncbi:MAG: 16S rRNA (adenine(1518)-N(6)/adenine(1519)-N(6))-dimethyltransferase RsmA [Endomicrobiaceae bacterium]|nr:16S rRNA (adenine(1518)-N(6)/adenine(1519)-N(6))-dimethyltransferase RsmA [Endomicrobiaceae bacterium]MDD3922227.1 16S rRNA (adenine(1518)-N(6)/adenine(1519)-N(6))-dimethyltransferase RsmA [Endomicrobiaceae bacterium]